MLLLHHWSKPFLGWEWERQWWSSLFSGLREAVSFGYLKIKWLFLPRTFLLTRRYSDIGFVCINAILTFITQMSYSQFVPCTQAAQFQSCILLNYMLNCFLLQAEVRKWVLIEQGKEWEEILEYLASRRKASQLGKKSSVDCFKQKESTKLLGQRMQVIKHTEMWKRERYRLRKGNGCLEKRKRWDRKRLTHPQQTGNARKQWV